MFNILMANAQLPKFKPFKSDTSDKKELNVFTQTFTRKVIYKEIPRENLWYGKLLAVFSLNKARKVKYIRILESPDDILSNQVIDALRDIEYPKSLKTGKNYALPINFKFEFLGAGSTLTHRVPPPDSIYKILPSPSKRGAIITYNPENVKLPSRAILLDEIIKIGYIILNDMTPVN
jgi:hypothetical protein